MSDDAAVPVLSLTPLNPAFRDDPHALLGDLRARCPVMWDDMAGLFFLTRHEDVRRIVTAPGHWRDPTKAEPGAVLTRRVVEEPPGPSPRQRHPSILNLDDPDHARVRPPLAQALYKRAAKCRPQVEHVVNEALDRMAGQDRCDLMRELAVPVPIDVIAAILGVERHRLAEFRDWSEGVIQFLNPLRTEDQTAHMFRSADALNAYMSDLLETRRRAPQDDLVSDMVGLQAQGAPLTDIELVTNLNALLIGGNLTTTDLIGNAVRLFLTHPEELAKLKAAPDLIASAVEEVLRFEPPVDITGRILSHDEVVGGVEMKTAQSLFLSLRAANRDPAVFEDPDRFDITRKKAPHVAFGGGAHICIGAPLARLEAQVALGRLFERFPNLALAEPQAPPQWRTLPFFRGLERLELTTGRT